MGGSSIIVLQYPWGLALTEPLTRTLIFIVVSYAALAAECASEMTADSYVRL